ncbi:hypothetical protein ACWEQC_26025 [Streptomyces shenzhenensis]
MACQVLNVARQAVRDVCTEPHRTEPNRTEPSSPPADPSVDRALAVLRRVVDDLAAGTHTIGG